MYGNMASRTSTGFGLACTVRKQQRFQAIMQFSGPIDTGRSLKTTARDEAQTSHRARSFYGFVAWRACNKFKAVTLINCRRTYPGTVKVGHHKSGQTGYKWVKRGSMLFFLFLVIRK